MTLPNSDLCQLDTPHLCSRGAEEGKTKCLFFKIITLDCMECVLIYTVLFYFFLTVTKFETRVKTCKSEKLRTSDKSKHLTSFQILCE